MRFGILFRLAFAAAAAPWVVGTAEAANPTPIKHVIMIMMENRSFDHYFGTFPGAEGMDLNVCLPVYANRATPCVKPFHNPLDSNAGANHDAKAARNVLNDGVKTAKMDGFVWVQTSSVASMQCTKPYSPNCSATVLGGTKYDAMGYHTADDIPNYWAYAQNFVLQDHMFEGYRAWSFPSHLDQASEWSATCTDPLYAGSCFTAEPQQQPGPGLRLPWVSLFQLLDINNVSWKWYLARVPSRTAMMAR